MGGLYIHIFRRDHRVVDNVALCLLLEECVSNDGIFVPLFVFIAEQVDSKINSYYSANSFRFMLESLEELDEELGGRMMFIDSRSTEDALEEVEKRFKKKMIEGVSWNLDYTPYARQRDEKILSWVTKRHNKINVFNDSVDKPEYTLFSPLNKDTLVASTGKGYRVYGAFRKKVWNLVPCKPTNKTFEYNSIVSRDEYKKVLDAHIDSVNNNKLAAFPKFKGGRKEGLAKLDMIRKGKHKDYGEMRDNMIADRTTGLSPYLKYGCVSIREAYWVVKESDGSDDLVKQLIWKEFYAHVAYHFPHVLRGSSMYLHFDECNSVKSLWVRGKTLKQRLDNWKLGLTGVDIVDAAMNQLNTTGWMHNRGRMIVASFLVKDLHVDWREGERYFAQMLIDYDPANNNGGWQWVAGVGVDAAPYFRVFNPWLQEKRFDKNREYIEKYKIQEETKSDFSTDMHKKRSSEFVNSLKECSK